VVEWASLTSHYHTLVTTTARWAKKPARGGGRQDPSRNEPPRTWFELRLDDTLKYRELLFSSFWRDTSKVRLPRQTPPSGHNRLGYRAEADCSPMGVATLFFLGAWACQRSIFRVCPIPGLFGFGRARLPETYFSTHALLAAKQCRGGKPAPDHQGLFPSPRPSRFPPRFPGLVGFRYLACRLLMFPLRERQIRPPPGTLTLLPLFLPFLPVFHGSGASALWLLAASTLHATVST